MTDIQVKDAKGGFNLPNMDKDEVHKIMQGQYFRDNSIESIEYKDCHTKGIIIDTDGILYLQKRSVNERDNGGLIDTSWGSHVEAGDTIITSAMYASSREFSTAMTVLGDEYFFPMLENHPDIISELAVTRQIAHMRNFKSERLLSDNRKWPEPCELTFFVSYFNGKFKPKVGSKTSTEYFLIDDLCNEIQKHPEQFTYDLREMVKRHSNLLIPYNELPDFSDNPNPKAKEFLQEYDLDGNPLKNTVSRKEAHKHLIETFHSGNKPQKKHRHIRVMIKKTDGTYFLQRRANSKNENAGLIDKPVGGHVGLGDIYDTAVIHECNDELSIPAAVLQEEDFKAIISNRSSILKHQAVLMRLGILEDYVSKGRTLKGKKPWDELGDTAVYLGAYDGPIKFKDGEVTGVEVKSFGELKEELKEKPRVYTNDLVDLVKLLEQKGLN